jgi:hypothetical protein
MKTIIKIVFVGMLILSCNKDTNDISIDVYDGYFRYDDPEIGVRYSLIYISASNKEYIVMNGDAIDRDKKNVSGEIRQIFFNKLPSNTRIKIEGKIKKKSITGTFVQLAGTDQNPVDRTGAFEIVQK